MNFQLVASSASSGIHIDKSSVGYQLGKQQVAKLPSRFFLDLFQHHLPHWDSSLNSWHSSSPFSHTWFFSSPIQRPTPRGFSWIAWIWSSGSDRVLLLQIRFLFWSLIFPNLLYASHVSFTSHRYEEYFESNFSQSESIMFYIEVALLLNQFGIKQTRCNMSRQALFWFLQGFSFSNYRSESSKVSSIVSASDFL